MPEQKQFHIMESVDILDRIHIIVFQHTAGHFDVTFECREKDKQIVLDSKALATMEQKVMDLCRDKNAADPNTRGYIEEYIGRLLTEYHKLGLAVIEDVPDAPSDPYQALRKKYKN